MPRTTLDIDPDLLLNLKRFATEAGEPLTRAANRVLRAGLDAATRPKPAFGVEITPVNLGRAHVNLDRIADALAIAEGDNWR